MTTTHFSDEIIIAYADGELEPDQRAALERQMEADGDLADRVARLAESRVRAKAALAPLLNEPVPAALSANIAAMVDKAEQASSADDATIVSLAARRRHGLSAGFARWDMPIAASVALVMGTAAGFLIATYWTDTPPGLRVANLEQAGLVAALNTIPAGDESNIGAGDRFRAIATYRDADGAVCREFEVDHADTSTVVAVACRPAAAWELQFAVVADQNNDGYAPASSLESLDAYLTAVGAGEPLSPDDEKTVLDGLN